MAFVVKGRVTLSGVDISDHVHEVRVQMTQVTVDAPAMGSGGQERLAGIRDDAFALVAQSNFNANKIDQLVAAALQVGQVVVEVQPAAPSAPTYSGTAILTEYQPMGGSVGDVSLAPLTLPVKGSIRRTGTGTYGSGTYGGGFYG